MCSVMDVVTKNVSLPKDKFWKALKIYYDHPNSVNKQILFSENLWSAKLGNILTENYRNELYSAFDNLLISGSNFATEAKKQQFSKLHLESFEDVNLVFGESSGIYVLIRKLISKISDYSDWGFYEIIFLDKEETKVYIYTKYIQQNQSIKELNVPGSKKWDPFIILKFKQIHLSYSNDILNILYNNEMGEKGINWLKCTFIVKFAKIMANIKEDNINSKTSLCFTNKVDVVKYYRLYEEMKLKYASFLIENWTENTDAKKFVHEDIGIATYLMLLWNGGNISGGNVKKQKFIDLGCGNGLLVHILNSEGHLGIGLDIRKRKIWSKYNSNTILKEETIIPTMNTSYPEADWLIGNHSDELTAWIPIMARRSNKNCQYFVLPCCPYQLNGQKFQRKNCGLSSYQDFIHYVKDVSELCEFETYVDKLRIPSTKRVCLIGMNKPDISDEKFESINYKLIEFVNQECQTLVNDDEKDVETNFKQLKETKRLNSSSLDFKIRDSVEKVRNCTKLPQSLLNKILATTMNVLLNECNFCIVTKNNITTKWNRGRKLLISELAKAINNELLKQLKEECKGLQTLLKNHHYIFEVSQGFVQFRSPDSLLQICNKFKTGDNQSKWKKRECWFYNNHPNKCPLSDDVCSYAHGS